MSYIPTPEQAEELVKKYNEDPCHIQHAQTVSKVMGEFAKEYDPDNVDFWRAVGMLHDIDFEQWPEEHCVKADKRFASLILTRALFMPWSATVTAYAAMLSRKNLWKRSCLPQMRADGPYRRRGAYAAHRHIRHGGQIRIQKNSKIKNLRPAAPGI